MQNILTDAVRHLKSIREEDVASMNAEEACTQSALKEACTPSAMPCVDDGAVPIEWCMRAGMLSSRSLFWASVQLPAWHLSSFSQAATDFCSAAPWHDVGVTEHSSRQRKAAFEPLRATMMSLVHPDDREVMLNMAWTVLYLHAYITQTHTHTHTHTHKHTHTQVLLGITEKLELRLRQRQAATEAAENKDSEEYMVAGASRASGLQEPGEDGDAKTDMDDTDACLRFRVRIARFVEGNLSRQPQHADDASAARGSAQVRGDKVVSNQMLAPNQSLPAFSPSATSVSGVAEEASGGTGSFGFPDMPLDDYDPLLEDDMELDGGSWHDSDSADDTDNADNDKALTRFVEYVPLTFTIVPIKHRTDVFYIVANLPEQQLPRSPFALFDGGGGDPAEAESRKVTSDLSSHRPFSPRSDVGSVFSEGRERWRRGPSAHELREIFRNVSGIYQWDGSQPSPGRAREMSGGSVGLDKSEMSILEMLSGVAGSWCTRTLTDYAYQFLQFHVMIEENSHGMPVVQCHCRVKVPRMFGGFASQWRKYLELSLDGQVNNLQNLRSIAMSPTLCTNFSLPTEPRGMIMGGEGDRCHHSPDDLQRHGACGYGWSGGRHALWQGLAGKDGVGENGAGEAEQVHVKDDPKGLSIICWTFPRLGTKLRESSVKDEKYSSGSRRCGDSRRYINRCLYELTGNELFCSIFVEGTPSLESNTAGRVRVRAVKVGQVDKVLAGFDFEEHQPTSQQTSAQPGVSSAYLRNVSRINI